MDGRDLMLYEDARKLNRALELMKELSFESELGVSLKNSLAKIEERFENWRLFDDFEKAGDFYTERLPREEGVDLRIKAPESIENKLLRTRLMQQKGVFRPFEKTLNDLIGLRIIVSDYSLLLGLSLGDGYRIVDMSQGKATDDGYRGIHVYYQPDHKHYPVELQIMTEQDRIFNLWLHEYTYKIQGREDVGRQLRKLYEKGFIRADKDFKESLDVLLSS